MGGRIRLAAVATIAVAVCAAPAETAAAGTYTVEACQSAKRWGYGSFAFELTRSSRLLDLDRGCGRERGLAAVVEGALRSSSGIPRKPRVTAG